MTTEELRNLDAEVHRKVFGLFCEKTGIRGSERVDYVTYSEHGAAWIPDYTTDIAAAWRVVDAMYRRTSLLVTIKRTAWDRWVCFIGGDDGGVEPTAPLAICRAALKALEGGK